MPRKSKAALTIAHIGPGARRLDPPPEPTGRAADIFRHTVASAEYGHYQPEDMSLLVAYSQTVVLAETAAAELAANPVVDGKVSPWLAIQKEQVRLLAMLSTRLKIGPKSRRPDSRRATKPTPVPSILRSASRQRAAEGTARMVKTKTLSKSIARRLNAHWR